jgi:drug/metabolite transporter (DMT)-like permease
LLWLVAVAVLARRGRREPWLAALFGFPAIVGVMFAIEPSFRGDANRDYLVAGAVLAGVVWVLGTGVSTAI